MLKLQNFEVKHQQLICNPLQIQEFMGFKTEHVLKCFAGLRPFNLIKSYNAPAKFNASCYSGDLGVKREIAHTLAKT